MTKTAIKRAFQELDTTAQAEVLGELAASLAKSLATMDRADANIFRRRRREERNATPLAEVKRRLTARRKGH